MEKNFDNMTLGELRKLQELLSTEIHKREQEERCNAKNKIYELLDEIETICKDNDLTLYRPISYDDDCEVRLSLSDVSVV